MKRRRKEQSFQPLRRFALLLPALLLLLTVHFSDFQASSDAFAPSKRCAVLAPLPTLQADHPLNVGTVNELDALPGIGPALAQNIVETREARGGSFALTEDLLEVSGIGPAKLSGIERALTMTPEPDDVINSISTSAPAPELSPEHLLNTGDLAALDELPGIGPVIAQRIIDTRESEGPFRAWEDLLTVDGIGEKRLEQIREALERMP